ncbi:MAG: hypothetical protein QM731_03950 [Chitinophagaceae bacterium]
MIKLFYVSFKPLNFDSSTIKHISYNVHERLSRLKYVTYRRIDILLDLKRSPEPTVVIDWDDNKTARIDCYIDEAVLRAPELKENISLLYQAILSCLKEIWNTHQWDTNDLENMWLEIKKEDFKVAFKFGNKISSAKSVCKAEFYCEVYSLYADYYLDITGGRGKNKSVKRIHFLRGEATVELFFLFFPYREWIDSDNVIMADVNKEIFYIFNVHQDGFKIEYKPSINSLEKLKDYVSAFQFGISKTERMKLLGLPESWGTGD